LRRNKYNQTILSTVYLFMGNFTLKWAVLVAIRKT